jgi:nucleoid-associated protein YejK
MKKMIVLVGFFLLSVSAQAEVIVTPMLDFTPTDMGFVFEIKTTKFKNVTLDCQSFITGIKFEEQGGEVHDFYLDMFQCEEAYNYFTEAKREKLPVCLGVDKDINELLVTHAEEQDCN